MITIKNKDAIYKMGRAGQLLAGIFNELIPLIVPGISTFEIDAFVEKRLRDNGLLSKMKGYMGYKHVSCVSINDEVVHGVPHRDSVLKNGDIVKVDVCASWKGYSADMARVFFVGDVKEEVRRLVAVGQSSLEKGIAQARAGNYLTDISAAIQKEVEANGFGVVRDFAGHGIGKQMHEDPEILNYGVPGKGPLLKPGMTFALEPMVTMGHYDVYVAKDGWTVRTVDTSMAVHVEDTVLITNNEPVVLTRLREGI
ncbi:MAG TPA: type I methionyl aminopeptidase [Candidatus Babeliales bacterium]|nr:type I methionyl aminopeptidase [Candidatus Babeliales bacterium]